MMRARTILFALAAAGVAAAAAIACLDLTPVTYVPPQPDAESDTGAALDAGADADVDPRGECVHCITEPDDASPRGCADEVAACQASPECAATYACALARHCFEQPTFTKLVGCGLPCAIEAGIVDLQDPAFALINNTAICAARYCNVPCHIGDAGIPEQ